MLQRLFPPRLLRIIGFTLICVRRMNNIALSFFSPSVNYLPYTLLSSCVSRQICCALALARKKGGGKKKVVKQTYVKLLLSNTLKSDVLFFSFFFLRFIRYFTYPSTIDKSNFAENSSTQRLLLFPSKFALETDLTRLMIIRCPHFRLTATILK